jgi:threonine dehydrogenase-like Zn-dependent dehydrogenase
MARDHCPSRLEHAPDAYKNFDDRNNGWTKVVLKPEG